LGRSVTDMEPSPIRNVGPFESADEAHAQASAATYGIPSGDAVPGFAGELILMEALMLGGVQVSAYEDIERATLVRMISPEVAQVIAGWVIRAHLAGIEEGQQEG
jgi:hypothetical protein